VTAIPDCGASVTSTLYRRSKFAAESALVLERVGETQLVEGDAPAGELALRPGPAIGVAVGQHGDEVAAGPQGRGQEGEERGLFVEQAVEVQADPHDALLFAGAGECNTPG
jgi:hypothetical protein